MRRGQVGGVTILLTIAGFDPSSGAGVTADLAVFRAYGCFGTSCVTALTVQSTVGVVRVEPVAVATVAETLACLEDDLPAEGIKIGMLASAENVGAVAGFLRGRRERGRGGPVVLDPVLRSSSGRDLLSAAGVDGMRREFLPLVDWVTPNVAELAVLAGVEVRTRGEMEAGARRLQGKFSRVGVVVTGGHLEGAGVPDLVLAPGAAPVWLEGERVVSRATHGTGCAFSSALTCGLVAGLPAVEAARGAKEFVTRAIRTAVTLGRGRGPMNLSGE